MLVRNKVSLMLALCTLVGAGCSDEKESTAADAGGQEKPDAGERKDAATSDTSVTSDAGQGDPIYLITVGMPGTGDDDLGSLYGLLRNELDLNVTREDFATEKAKEFEAYTGIAVVGGEVVIGESTRPYAKKFKVSDDFEWTQVGTPMQLDFTDYVVDAIDGLNFYYQSIRGTDMLLFYGADRSWRKRWNPAEWKLEEELTDTGDLPLGGDGWALASTGNRTGVRDWQGPVMQTFVLRDEDWNNGPKSWIAVYDEDTFEQKATIEVPCPGLEQQSMTENGDIYVSTSFHSPLYQLYGLQDPSCIVRMKKGGTQDDTWGSKTLSELTTGGFDGVGFRYLKDGIAAANVLHHDRIEGADFKAGEIQKEVSAQVDGATVGDKEVPQDASLWELELIDLEAGTSRPVTGWEEGHDPGSYTIYHLIEDRIFISYSLDPEGLDWGQAIYELDLENAKVKLVGTIAGALWGIERVR